MMLLYRSLVASGHEIAFAMMKYLTDPIVLLTIGGAAGTNARYLLTHWIAAQNWTTYFPLATFLINISGSLLLGLCVVPFKDRFPGWYILLGVGFCGGYTTFSTFALETVTLFRREPAQPGLALLNVVASVVVSCVVTWLAVSGMESIYPPTTHQPPAMGGAEPQKQTEP